MPLLLVDRTKSLLGRIRRVFRGSSSNLPAPTSAKSITTGSSDDPPWVFYPSASIRGAYDQSGALSKELASVWVYACASLIARSVAAIPLKVLRDGEEVDPKTDPLARLLNKPAPNWTGTRLREAMTLYMELTGSTYLQKVRSRARGESQWTEHRAALRRLGIDSLGMPVQLWPFGEDSYETHINESQGVPATGFIPPYVRYYSDANGRRQEIWDVVQVLYHRVGDGNEGEGLAPVEGARLEVASDAEAASWQAQSFQNRAVPDGVLTIMSDMTEDQWQATQDHIKAQWSGPANAHRTVVIGAQKSSYMALARNAVELDFANGRKLTREGICGGMGTPPVLVGILDRATYSNLKQAELVFYRSTVLPKARLQLDAINREIAPEFGADYEVVLDTSGVDALLQITSERWDLADKMWAKGVPMSQINNLLGLGLEAYPGWDRSYLPTSVQAVGTPAAEAVAEQADGPRRTFAPRQKRGLKLIARGGDDE